MTAPVTQADIDASLAARSELIDTLAYAQGPTRTIVGYVEAVAAGAKPSPDSYVVACADVEDTSLPASLASDIALLIPAMPGGPEPTISDIVAALPRLRAYLAVHPTDRYGLLSILASYDSWLEP